MKIDCKKLASDLFQARSTLLAKEYIKWKTRLPEQPQNLTIALKRFYMQYRYLAKSLWDQCKLVAGEVKKKTESAKH